MALSDPNVTLTARSMVCLRVQHLSVAAAAAESLVLWERENTTRRNWYRNAFMRGSVAIVMSAFALEAAINEAATMLHLADDVFEQIDRLSTLDKADKIAKVVGFSKINRGDKIAQHARLLFRLRDGLAHGKAEWSDEHKRHAALSEEVVALQIPLSRFMIGSDRAFPVGCMSGAIASWAVDTAQNYIDAYYATADIPH